MGVAHEPVPIPAEFAVRRRFGRKARMIFSLSVWCVRVQFVAVFCRIDTSVTRTHSFPYWITAAAGQEHLLLSREIQRRSIPTADIGLLCKTSPS